MQTTHRFATTLTKNRHGWPVELCSRHPHWRTWLTLQELPGTDPSPDGCHRTKNQCEMPKNHTHWSWSFSPSWKLTETPRQSRRTERGLLLRRKRWNRKNFPKDYCQLRAPKETRSHWVGQQPRNGSLRPRKGLSHALPSASEICSATQFGCEWFDVRTKVVQSVPSSRPFFWFLGVAGPFSCLGLQPSDKVAF